MTTIEAGGVIERTGDIDVFSFVAGAGTMNLSVAPARRSPNLDLRAELRDGRAFASTIQDSSMLRTLARAACLIVRAPHAPEAKIGDSAEILDLA